MGTGKVALQLFLQRSHHVFGIELAPSRWRLAMEALASLAAARPKRFGYEVQLGSFPRFVTGCHGVFRSPRFNGWSFYMRWQKWKRRCIFVWVRGDYRVEGPSFSLLDSIAVSYCKLLQVHQQKCALQSSSTFQQYQDLGVPSF